VRSASIDDAVARQDARALLEIAAGEAKRLDRENVFHVLRHLGSLSRVTFADDARTARLRLKCREYRIEFCRQFIAEHVETPLDILHLLLHELLHRVRGDLHRARPDGIPAGAFRVLANFAADMLVNADLDASVLGTTPEYFLRLYPRDRFPENLLLPPWLLLDVPRGTPRAELENRCAAAFRCAPDPVEVTRVYLAAWLDEPSFEGLLRALHQMMPAPPSSLLETVPWLGDHNGEEEDREWIDARLREWFHAQGQFPAGRGEDIRERETEEPPQKRAESAFFEAVRRAIVNDPSCPRIRQTLSTDRGVVPFPGRREAFLLAARWWPVFFPNVLQAPDEDEQRVHLYIDTSGSTRRLWSFLYGLVLHLHDEIGDPVYLFSNAVAPVGIADLRAGRVLTTGGTDFDCVAEHALSRRFRRILVATDGEAPLDEAVSRRLRQQHVGVFVVLTAENEACPLLSLARGVWTIPTEFRLPPWAR